MQEVLKRGAVIEASINDVPLGADTVEDDLKLPEEFLRTCDECHTKVKLSKCEFMKEFLEYLGFEVVWQWWRDVTDKVAPILQAMIRDKKTRGAKDIRSFLGACNVYGRHVPKFTYSSHSFTDLTKEEKKWHRGGEEAKQFQELNQKLGNRCMLGTPNSEGEFLATTDASLVGGGGNLFEWLKIPKLVACTLAEELQNTLEINGDGTLKHNNDAGCWHLVPIGHGNWKWNSTGANYSTYERELLSGILLLSGQECLLGTNPLVWFCDQESTEYFLKGDPPENRTLWHWWTYFAQLCLNIYRVLGLKNELCKWLSRESFDDKISASCDQLSREGFGKVHVHFGLVMSKVALLDSIRSKDY